MRLKATFVLILEKSFGTDTYAIPKTSFRQSSMLFWVSFPHVFQPAVSCLAKSSIRGMSPTRKVRCSLPQGRPRGAYKVPLCSWPGSGVLPRRIAAFVRTSTGDRRRLCRIPFQWFLVPPALPDGRVLVQDHTGGPSSGRWTPRRTAATWTSGSWARSPSA